VGANSVKERASDSKHPQSKPSVSQPSWMSVNQWQAAQSLERAMASEGLRGLCASLSQHAEAWQHFASSPEPDRLSTELLQGLSDGLWESSFDSDRPDSPSPSSPPSFTSDKGSFLLLLLIKALCEDRLMAAIKRYIEGHLGPKFSPGSIDDDPVSSSGSLSQSALSELYHDSNPSTPIIFILSSGADPSAALSKFGASLDREAGDRLHIISLGQGQGPIAESTLQSSIKNGDWVCLQVSC
jgi:dynein heavy chain